MMRRFNSIPFFFTLSSSCCYSCIRNCSTNSSSSSSDFLSSLLKNAEETKNQQQDLSTTTISSSNQINTKNIPAKLFFDPDKLKLNVIPPGLSKKEENQKNKTKSFASHDDEDDEDFLLGEREDFGFSGKKNRKQNDEDNDDGFDSSSSSRVPGLSVLRSLERKEKQEKNKNTKTEEEKDQEVFDKMKKRKQLLYEQKQQQRMLASKTESSFAVLTVSRRMGDWEEAMRIAAQHWQFEPCNNNNTNKIADENNTTTTTSRKEENEKNSSSSSSFITPTPSPSSLSQELGMVAQAAWACSKAVELSVLMTGDEGDSSSEKQNENNNDNNAAVSSSVLGPIEALNMLTSNIVYRFECAKQLQEEMQNNNKNGKNIEIQNQQPATTFVQSGIGCLLSLSEALRACGGVDLVMALDSSIGDYMRNEWKQREVLLIETQRWNHEVLKNFDVLDDWKGALQFFLIHSKSNPQKEEEEEEKMKITTSSSSEKEKEQEKSEEEVKPQKTTTTTTTSFSFKEKDNSQIDEEIEDIADRFVFGHDENDKKKDEKKMKQSVTSKPSIYGASTVAMLLELLNRQGKHKIVGELLKAKLIRDAEALQIGRAYALLINSWGNSMSSRRLRDSTLNRDFSVSGNESSNLKMPKMSLGETQHYRSNSS